MKFYLCRFLEYGEYKDNLYGTSLESIHKVLTQNKVCLMDVQPEVRGNMFSWPDDYIQLHTFNTIQFPLLAQTLKTLHTAEFKPYIIFVKPHISESQNKPQGSSSSHSFKITVSSRASETLKRLPTVNLISSHLCQLGGRPSGNEEFCWEDGRVLWSLGGLCAGEGGPRQRCSRAAAAAGESADGAPVGACVLAAPLTWSTCWRPGSQSTEQEAFSSQCVEVTQCSLPEQPLFKFRWLSPQWLEVANFEH